METYKSKIQVGYSKTKETREVGDKWTDSDGYMWEQKEGFQVKLSNMPAVGMFNHQCKVCKKIVVQKWQSRGIEMFLKLMVDVIIVKWIMK